MAGRIEDPLHERKTRIISRLLLITIQLKINYLNDSLRCKTWHQNPYPLSPSTAAKNDALDDLERIVVDHENTDTYDAHKIEI